MLTSVLLTCNILHLCSCTNRRFLWYRLGRSQVAAGEAKKHRSGFSKTKGFKFDSTEMTAGQALRDAQRRSYELEAGIKTIEVRSCDVVAEAGAGANCVFAAVLLPCILLSDYSSLQQ